MHVLWGWLKEDSVAYPCRSAGSVKPSIRRIASREGAKCTVIFTGYRKGQHASSCGGHFHKPYSWGQVGSYQKPHLYIMLWAKGQLTDNSQAERGAMRTGKQAWDLTVRSWEPQKTWVLGAGSVLDLNRGQRRKASNSVRCGISIFPCVLTKQSQRK